MFDSHLISTSTNPQFLRHDLIIELGRLEMALEDIGRCSAVNDPDTIAALQSEQVRLAGELKRLSGT